MSKNIKDIESYQNFIDAREGVFVSDRIWDTEANKVTCIKPDNRRQIKIDKDFCLFRYMPFSRLYTELKDKTLTFISPKKWDDPYESLFLQEDKIKIKEDKVLNGCLCFTYNRFKGEEAAWKLRKDDEPVVKICVNFSALLDGLSLIASNLSMEFYISLCNYSLNKSDIDSSYTAYKNLTEIKLEDYLNCMSVKRKAFEHECEVRIFAVSKKNNEEENKKEKEQDQNVISYKVGNYKDLITEILLPPLKGYNPGDSRYKHYVEIQDIYNKGMRVFFYDYFQSIVSQSRLYQCEKVKGK